MMSPVRTAPGVIARNIGGETVLVPTHADIARFDRIFVLSRVGAFLWPLLDGTRDRDQLCRLVRDRYEIPSDADVSKDVDDFLAGLHARGLLAS